MTQKKRPTLTLKGKPGKAAPAAAGAPQRPAPKSPRPKGPAYTPPKALHPYKARFWLVMRASGQRPRRRHPTLAEAQEEARRIAWRCPGVPVWIIECATMATIVQPAASSPAGGSP